MRAILLYLLDFLMPVSRWFQLALDPALVNFTFDRFMPTVEIARLLQDGLALFVSVFHHEKTYQLNVNVANSVSDQVAKKSLVRTNLESRGQGLGIRILNNASSAGEAFEAEFSCSDVGTR